MKKLFLLVGAAVLLLVALIVVRTLLFTSPQSIAERAPLVTVPEAAAERLAGSLRFPTISHEDPSEFDGQAFQNLHAYLRSAFPRTHLELRCEVIGTHSLLYTWQGSDTSRKPILLMGHLDVVPVEPGSEERWSQQPFSGRIVDGMIWGRGAIDDKAAVVGTLEAVELLLNEGFRPVRTVYLAYGHDEEVGGTGGAREIAALLASRGVELEMALDEGGVISDGILPGISGPVALVGIAEKGFVSVELSTRAAAAHSSLPPHQTAIGILSAAIARLEVNPMPARLDGATRQLFARLGPRFPFARRAVFANLWLTAPLVTKLLERTPTTNAMVRTTAAPTMWDPLESTCRHASLSIL